MVLPLAVRVHVILLSPKSARHLDGKHTPAPAGHEMRGLAAVRAARLDAVVGPDRDIHFLALSSDCNSPAEG